MDKPRCVVVGGGVIGLSAALRIVTQVPGVEVTLVADKFEEDTTSHGAAGLWEPYKLSDTPPERVNAWGEATYRYLEITGVQTWTRPTPDPDWRAVVPHFRRLTAAELRTYAAAGDKPLVDGWSFTTLMCQGSHYLPWLRMRLQQRGCRIVQRRLSSLAELRGYDVIVNCTGLGAASLFGDTSMYPIRGHVLRVHAPWIKQVYFMDEETYIIPNTDSVVLGGLGQVGDWSLKPRSEDRDAIWQRCLKFMPSLAQARQLREWVGLRPGRPSVRLEMEALTLPGNTASTQVIHCYGHGGAGITLHWGCAGEVANLVAETCRNLQQRPTSRL